MNLLHFDAHLSVKQIIYEKGKYLNTVMHACNPTQHLGSGGSRNRKSKPALAA